jgi:hypothetical protein
MIDRDAIRGGFGGSLRSQMSDQLQRKIAAEEAAEAREAAQEERARAQRVEALQENAIQAAIAMAIENGEEFHPRMLRGERIGHTSQEFIAMVSAQQDLQDAQLAARQRITYNRWLEQQGELNSGDMTAPSPEETSARAERDERHRQARIESSVRRYERKKTVKEARSAALHDTLTIAASLEQDRRGY